MGKSRFMTTMRMLTTLVLCLMSLAMLPGPTHTTAQNIAVDTNPGHVLNKFRPLYALGSTVDRIPSNATDSFFKPETINQILSAGWGVISYRQNTDLFVQAWHWNPKGKWSDPNGEGYFVGDANPNETIRHSYGYDLPHRGFWQNQGTEDTGFSRLNDGDLNTYWKSNPYLTQAFTGEDDSLHPQWITIDLDKPQEITAIRIAWAEPYARVYDVQYFTGSEAMDDQANNEWKALQRGSVTNGKGGTVTLQLTATPVKTRWIRVWMTESSNTCDTHGSADRRNCVGYAIKEVYVGNVGDDGRFNDLLRHSPNQQQSHTFCSSVDPWHRPSDLLTAPDHMESGDQPGFDLFFTSGITRGLPAIVPVAMAYSTPEDAAAEIAYLEARKYPILQVEMGEEPDGQYMIPEDYAALYLQWAKAIHSVDPTLKLGGPVFEGVNEDIKVWTDTQGRNSWFGRFLAYLRDHNRFDDLAFVSFEHYPYDGCETPWKNLYQEPALITHIMQVWRDDGLPPNVPMFDTETNAHGGEAAVDIFGALWLADSFGGFLSAGGKGTYYYHALAWSPAHANCANSWGTYHMFMIDSNYMIRSKTSQYFAAHMITHDWVEPGEAEHKLFKATSDVKDSDGNMLVTAYAVQRPDGDWALMVINKDHDHPHQVHIFFNDGSGKRRFTGSVHATTFGKAQYEWHQARRNGYAQPDGPAVISTINADANTVYTLPAASLNVLRGRLSTE